MKVLTLTFKTKMIDIKKCFILLFLICLFVCLFIFLFVFSLLVLWFICFVIRISTRNQRLGIPQIRLKQKYQLKSLKITLILLDTKVRKY